MPCPDPTLKEYDILADSDDFCMASSKIKGRILANPPLDESPLAMESVL
jgi:hypothetical protein